jgi:hypothetical protein
MADLLWLLPAIALACFFMGWLYERIAPDRLRRMAINLEAARPGSVVEAVAYQHQIALGLAAAVVYVPLAVLLIARAA